MVLKTGRSIGRRWAVGVATLLITSACASARPPLSGDSSATESRLYLRVVNRGYTDVVVYLAGGSVPHRLGRVPATQQADLVIRGQSGVGSPVRLVLRDAGSGETFTPDPIWGRAGDVIELTVQPLLSTSELTVR